MNILEQSLLWFNTKDKKKQLMIGSGLFLIFIMTGILILWSISPSYSILFHHLDHEDANRILSLLEESNITYKVSNQGEDILIPKELVNKTRIKLMGNDLNLTHSIGLELFDRNDFGMTDFTQKINYQRALQGELERTISSLDEVKKARVQLVLPENHLFQDKQSLPRAAISLHLKQPLTQKQIKSIQLLVTASVAHLSRSNVIIVDQRGNGLSNEEDAPNTHFTNKKSLENYLNDKVMQLLTRIFTQNNVLVKVDATLNYDELQRELISPRNKGLLTHEKETRHSSNKINKKTGTEEVSLEKSYELGHEKERFSRANGSIERLTISVLIPKNTNAQQISQIEQLVKSVVGFNAHRGDNISVAALIDEVIPEVPQTQISKPSTSYSLYLSLMGLLLVLIISIGFYFIQRHKNKMLLLLKPQVPSTIVDPEYCQESLSRESIPLIYQKLINQTPLYTALILEQGAYSWTSLFLKEYDKKGLIQFSLEHHVQHIKPQVKKSLFEGWHNSLTFEEQMEHCSG